MNASTQPDPVLNTATVSRRPPPRNLRPEDDALFRHEYEKQIPATFLRTKSDVTVLPSGRLFQRWCLLPEGYVGGQMPLWRERSKALAEYLSLAARSRAEHGGGTWITDNWSAEYFHWMTDALPRLFAVLRHGTDAVLILPFDYYRLPFVSGALAAMGIVERTVYIPARRAAIIRKLQLPTHTAPTGNYADSLIANVGALLKRYYAPTMNRTRRIYISRRDASRRRIKNEEELLPVLSRFGFQTVQMEKLSFAEQIVLCSEAEILVSNHGAGLTNMLFMSPGAKVVEIRKDDDASNNCYFSLASAIGLAYYYALAPAVDGTEEAHTADLIVDPRGFKRVLAEVVGDVL